MDIFRLAYDSCDEEGPLESVDFLDSVCAFHIINALQLVDKVGRVGGLHVEEHEPEVNADAAHHGAEVAAAQI